MLGGIFILKNLKEKVKNMKKNNKKLIFLIILIFVILTSIVITWKVMDSKFNSINKENVEIGVVEGSISEENILGKGKVIINITS